MITSCGASTGCGNLDLVSTSVFAVIFGKVTMLGTLAGCEPAGNAGTIATDGGTCNSEELTGSGTAGIPECTDAPVSEFTFVAGVATKGTPIAAIAVWDSPDREGADVPVGVGSRIAIP